MIVCSCHAVSDRVLREAAATGLSHDEIVASTHAGTDCGHCRETVAEGENGTADLLEDLLEDEEEHANWLEAQLTLIKQMGLENYLAEQIKKDG